MTPTLVLVLPGTRIERPQKGLVRRPHVDHTWVPFRERKTSELRMAIKRGNVLAWDKSASWRARGWVGENVARRKEQPWPLPLRNLYEVGGFFSSTLRLCCHRPNMEDSNSILCVN